MQESLSNSKYISCKITNLNRPEIVGDSTLQENTTMKTRKYTPEMKERAVRMLIEAKDDYPVTLPNLRHLINRIKLPDCVSVSV